MIHDNAVKNIGHIPFSWAWLVVLSAGIISIHFGYNEYFSVQFVLFLVLSLYLLYGADLDVGVIIFGALYLGIIIISSIVVGVDFDTFMRGARVAFVATVVFLLSRALSVGANVFVAVNMSLAVYLACIFSAALGLVQFLDSVVFNTGAFDIPVSFFAIEYGTLFADSRDGLFGTGYFIRPSGTYSEPSALLALGLLGLALAHFSRSIIVLPYFASLSIFVAIMSVSINGLIMLPIALMFYSRNSNIIRVFYWLAAIFVAALLIYLFVPYVQERIERVFAAEDTSTLIRVVEPLRIVIAQMSGGHWFGARPDVSMSFASESVYTIFNNWLFNQFLNYGILGVPLIILSLVAVPGSVRLLLLFFMFLNGEPFYYDRAVFIIVATAVYYGSRGVKVG